MRALITGGDGQLAGELVSTAPPEVELRALSRAECDISESLMVENVFKSFRPDLVINTAAYTAVDAAEDNQDLAFRVNARGAENVARAAKLVGSRLIHISTDYVFDGLGSTPYTPDAPTNPINVYGASKLEGEKLVLRATANAAVIRTSWLYSSTGRNFFISILSALSKGQPVSVVEDQHGCPTSAYDLAMTIWAGRSTSLSGIYHWANAGSTSWYDYAVRIAEMATDLGLLHGLLEIRPVAAADLRRRAKRPAYSLLDSTKLSKVLGMDPRHWEAALHDEVDRFSLRAIQ